MSEGGEPGRHGPESIREARALWRREQIVDATLRLLEDTAFQQMSVSDLADEAGISVGTVYQYVRNKEDILLLVISEILDAYSEAIPKSIAGIEDPVQRLVSAFRACCHTVAAHRATTALGYRESHILDSESRAKVFDLEERSTALLVECVEAAVESGDLLPHDTDLTGWNLMLLAHMWSLKHWHVAKTRSIDDYMRAQLSLVLRAVATPETQRRLPDLVELPQPPVESQRTDEAG